MRKRIHTRAGLYRESNLILFELSEQLTHLRKNVTQTFLWRGFVFFGRRKKNNPTNHIFPCKPLFVLTYAIFCDICCYERSGERNNMKIIEDLYYGRISPYEMSISATPEYQKLKALADRNEDLLRDSLSHEQKELLDKLIETVTDISSISERDMFIAGFRLGVKLMIDVMKDE